MEYLDFERPLIEIEKNISQLKEKALSEDMDFSDTIAQLEKEVLEKKKKLFQELNPSQRLKIARHPRRPLAMDYIRMIFKDFIELHGDRVFSDDPAIVGGVAHLGGFRVMVVALEKGRDTKEKLHRNFGTAHPEGYRKALRLMKTADRFGLSIIALIDTPGAYPGISAEERGQAIAIATNLREMMGLRVPMIPVIIGEGGSGGALGIGVGDKIIMLEHSYYSVISPEGCAAILWKNQEKAPDAAIALKMTARDLLGFGIIDEILEEPLGGAHRDPETTAKTLEDALIRSLEELRPLSPEVLLKKRYEKFRQMGSYRSEKTFSGENAPRKSRQSSEVNSG
jgi:acetyl-CoA carboxylase carboxyl transferase subunit alpha